MSSLKVGDVLATVAQLDSCPVGTIVRSAHGLPVEKGFDGEWLQPGSAAPYEAPELLNFFGYRWRVLWVPPVTRVEITTDTWIVDNGEVTFRHTPELLDLLRSVPVGERVRVTVEKVGDDDE